MERPCSLCHGLTRGKGVEIARKPPQPSRFGSPLASTTADSWLTGEASTDALSSCPLCIYSALTRLPSSHTESHRAMSLDEEATLASVRAFLDAFEASDVDCSPPSSDAAQSPASNASLELSNGSGRAGKARQRHKYTTVLQRRKRAELTALREEARTLEARLAQVRRLQRAVEGGAARMEGFVTAGKLEAAAEVELEDRRRAERTNRSLRSHLQRQQRLLDAVRRLVAKYWRREKSIGEVESLLMATRCCSAEPVKRLQPQDSSVQGHIAALQLLDVLIKQTDNVIETLPERTQSCWLETNTVSNRTEIRSFTIADCGVNEAAELLWDKPKIKLCPEVMKDEIFSSDGSYTKRSMLSVRCQPWAFDNTSGCKSCRKPLVEVLLHVEQFARYIQDPTSGRVMLVKLALIRLPGSRGEVLLREQFWKCISPTKEGGSVTQAYYRIESGDTQPGELSTSQASVMRALTLLTRKNHSAYQEWLLSA